MLHSGAAHGLCAILQMLLSFPVYLHSDPTAEQDVKASVDYLLSLQTRSGNFPCATDELGSRARSEADELVHWCHGAPGNWCFCTIAVWWDRGFGECNFDYLQAIKTLH